MSIGFYNWGRRKTAFRSDYCMNCEREVRANCVRSLVVLRLEFVPVFPLGFWKLWECSRCGQPPSCPPTARTAVLMLGAVVFGLFGLLLFWVGLTFDKVETAAILAIGAGFAAASAGLSLWCWQRSFAPSYADRFAEVRPSQTTTCPECGSELTMSETAATTECLPCGLQRL